MLYFVRLCVASTRGAGLLRTVMSFAAMITTFSILGATVSGDAHAQMTTRNPGIDAQIPDSPCMTSAERNQLRKISDEYNMVRGQLDNLDAQIEQDSSYKEYQQAKNTMERVTKNGAYETSDDMHAAEAAKKTLARLNGLGKLINRRAALAQRLTEIATRFYDLVHAIEGRKCPPPPPAADKEEERDEIGMYLGGQLLENWGRVRTTETLAATGQSTFQSTDSGDPLGFGFVAGYNFRPWNNKIIVGPFASFDWLNQTINHAFTGGQYYGTTTHWIATVGAKGGYVVTPGVYLYGLVGASWLNQSLNVNFATSASSNVTTPGFTLGFGGEYQPSSWRLFGNPVSVFMQYQHTWWGTANFNTPMSSPIFNYAFKREDNTLKLGVNIYLSR